MALIAGLLSSNIIGASPKCHAQESAIENSCNELNIVSNSVPQTATDYVNSVINDFLTQYEQKNLGTSPVEDYSALSLGTPYTVFNLDDQSTYYSYPIYENEDIKLIMDVMFDKDGYSACLSPSIAEQLNELGQNTDTENIIYTEGGIQYSQNSNNEITILCDDAASLVENTTVENNNSSLETTYEEKLNDLSKTYDIETNDISQENSSINIEANDHDQVNDEDVFKSSVSSNIFGKKIVSFPLVPQVDKSGKYRGLCWAACVASTVNCVKNKTSSNAIKAYQVADKMGISYDKGASLSQIKSALGKYNVSYGQTSSQIAFATIKNNIGKKRPVIMCSKSRIGGHATLIIGYSNETATGGLLDMYNPGTNTVQIVSYKSSGTQYTYSGTTFTWNGGTVY